MTMFTPGGPTRYHHQQMALQKLIDTKGVAALLLPPGLGKTAPTLDFASILALTSPRQEARVFVTGPLAVVDSWVAQASRWISPQVSYWVEAVAGSGVDKAMYLAARGGNPFPHDPKTLKKRRPRAGESPRAYGHHRTWALSVPEGFDPRQGPEALPGPRVIIMVLNLESLRRRDRVRSRNQADLYLDALKRFDPDLVVVDESHKIKSASSNSSLLMYRLGKTVKHRAILTGTPMPHSVMDLWAQWRFLEPTAFGELLPSGKRKECSRQEFENRFVRKGGFEGREIVGVQNLEELYEVLSHNAISFRKEDALDLPPVQDLVIPVHLSEAERKAYNEMKRDLATQVGTEEEEISSAPNKIVQRLRLRQVTAGHLPDDETGEAVEIGSSKVDMVKSHVQDVLTGEKRIVIFTYFKPEMEQLRRKLSEGEPGTVIYTIDGTTPKPARLRYRQHFATEDPQRIILIAQIGTISLSVNELVTAQHAIFTTLSEKRDDWIQGRDRLNRIGQTGNLVTFWYFNVPGSVDEVILDTFMQRSKLERSVMDHVRYAPDL